MPKLLLLRDYHFPIMCSFPNQSFPVSLRGSWFGLNQVFRSRLKGLGITPAQYTTLRHICEFDGDFLNQRTLAELLVSNENNLTAILHLLEQKGWILRKKLSMDRRCKAIVSTSKGRKLFLDAQVIAQRLQGEILKTYTKEEEETLFTCLESCSLQLQKMEE